MQIIRKINSNFYSFCVHSIPVAAVSNATHKLLRILTFSKSFFRLHPLKVMKDYFDLIDGDRYEPIVVFCVCVDNRLRIITNTKILSRLKKTFLKIKFRFMFIIAFLLIPNF